MRPVIDIRHIHRIFETEAGLAHILHDISLSVMPGEFLAIVGPSGSGKSTLMNILGCLDTPTSGTYLLEGLDLSQLDDDELAEIRATRIGFVFQSFNLLPRMSVLDNVMLPLAYTDAPRPTASAAPSTRCGPRGSPSAITTTGPTSCRAAKCSASPSRAPWSTTPPSVLADEPTGNLDSVTGRMVLDTFHALKRQGKTIVLITHDAGVAAEADRRVTIRDGRLYREPPAPPS